MLTETPKRFAPIETRFMGYRFRSRLEARWAYFLDRVHDAITRQWVYEPEGFRLGDDYYLPDFFLPNVGPKGTYVEVKPGPAPAYSVPRVYMAGRMRTDWRPLDVVLTEEGFQGANRVPPRRATLCGIPVDYTGPFLDSCKKHDLWHGLQRHYHRDDEFILARSIRGIDACDEFFAFFDDKEAFGTLVELGYAKAKGKWATCAFGPSLKTADWGRGDLWFAESIADVSLFGPAEEVLADFASRLRGARDQPREQRLAHALAEATGAGVAVVYGDPYDVFVSRNKNSAYLLGSAQGWAKFLLEERRLSTEVAAEMARGARFEHGAVP